MGEPGAEVSDLSRLLVDYLEWYRRAVLRKIAGLSDAELRAPVEPMGWSPLGLVKHLGLVERRWMRWGFAAEDIAPRLPGGERAEWTVGEDESAEGVLAAYAAEVERSQVLAAGIPLDRPAGLGGRFTDPGQVPTLGRILFHLFQEYARHVGQLDIIRELIDGTTGE
ncbi:MAG: DinB family protein [Gaiellaceae bacterium]